MIVRKRIFSLLIVATLGLSVASAQATTETLSSAVDMLWMILTGALVFFMQAGFAFVETGLTRAKNATNILMKNLMDFCFGSIVFWLIGWGFMYGTDKLGGFVGFSEFFKGPMGDPTFYRNWYFQVVFAATSATIVSGSTVVHSVGGWAAFVGAAVLGPRTGKYVKVDGKVIVKAFPGHNIGWAFLGVFILWFGWYGFNPGSTLSGLSPDIGRVAVTTTLGGSAGAVAALLFSWLWFRKPDASMTLNGCLAGLVAITAPCAVVSPGDSIVIGLIAGVLVVLAVEFIDKVLKVDDPVGASSVHLVNGIFGTLAVGLWGNVDGVAVGLFHGGGLHQLGVQALGVASVGLWAGLTSVFLFVVIKKTVGLRITQKEELMGLDLSEHKSEAYPGFQFFSNL